MIKSVIALMLLLLMMLLILYQGVEKVDPFLEYDNESVGSFEA